MAKGAAKLKAAAERKRSTLLAAVATAVEEEMDAAVGTAQGHVRKDTGSLKSIIAARSTGKTSGTVAPRPELAKDESAKDAAIGARVNEYGRKRDKGKPYMTPTAMAAKRSYPTRMKAAVRKALT